VGLPREGTGSVEGSHRKAGLSGRGVPAHTLFFPLAAAYAAAALPVSVAGMLGLVPALPGLGSPAAHAHEMLFGFALAAVAGNQLGPTPRAWLAALVGTWLLARATFVLAPASVAALAANSAFALLLAWLLAPRVVFAARKLRNRALPFTVVALCVTAIAAQAAFGHGSYSHRHAAMLTGLLLLSLLMLFMGGRIIAPAAAGAFYRQGGELSARVQPRIEGGLIALMLLAAACASLGALPAAGALATGAGLLAAVRMARWRLWALASRRDLLCLAAGYAWLAAGLVAAGIATMRGDAATTPMHAITVGAIGTLAINVMALTCARLARRDPARDALPAWSTLLIALATAARLAADGRPALLLFAAACWSLAWLLLLAYLARTRRRG